MSLDKSSISAGIWLMDFFCRALIDWVFLQAYGWLSLTSLHSSTVRWATRAPLSGPPLLWRRSPAQSMVFHSFTCTKPARQVLGRSFRVLVGHLMSHSDHLSFCPPVYITCSPVYTTCSPVYTTCVHWGLASPASQSPPQGSEPGAGLACLQAPWFEFLALRSKVK